MSDYDARALFHKPTDPAKLAAEVRRLHREGLRVRDIAEALRMNDADVAAILSENGAMA